MIGLVNKVREKLDSSCLVAGRLTKEGCRVLMTGVTDSRLVVDLDKQSSPAHSGAPHCDYLYIADDENGVGWVAPLELKRGRLHADRGCQTTPGWGHHRRESRSRSGADYVPARCSMR